MLSREIPRRGAYECTPRRGAPSRGNSGLSDQEHDPKEADPHENAADEMLALLSSAMNIDRARTPEAGPAGERRPNLSGERSPGLSGDKIPGLSGERSLGLSGERSPGLAVQRSAGLIDSSTSSLDCLSVQSSAGKMSEMSLSSTLHEDAERSTMVLASPRSSYHEFYLDSIEPDTVSTYMETSRSTSRTLDIFDGSSRPGSRQNDHFVPSRRTSRHADAEWSVRDFMSPRDSRIGTPQPELSKTPKKSSAFGKKEMCVPWSKKKNGKKMSKSEEEKRQLEIEMWNASDSTVLENLLSNKGHVGKWQAIASARGLCSLSTNCRCPDCQSSYVTYDNDGDAGMGAGAPLYNIMAPACCIQ